MEKYELDSLKEKASIGNEEAIISLSNYYLQNRREDMAYLTAQKLEFISSKKGYKYIASFYMKGIGTDIDLKKAKSLYSKSLALGDIDSGYNLALIAINENDLLLAKHYIDSGISKDHIPSIKLLASLYSKGEIVEKDDDKVIDLLKKAIELGDKSSAESLAKLYYARVDYEKAFKYFSIGADLKNLDSIYHLGLCYAKGLGVKQDFNLARKYYEIGANLFEPRCLYNLSLYYRNGTTISKNIELADKLEAQAIERGFKK